MRMIVKGNTKATAALRELIEAAHLTAGQLLVIGCSSSEMVGERIGRSSSMEAALALRDAVLPIVAEHGICLAVQCCEHLNRALIMERATAEKYGYDPKQLHHLVRVDNFQDRFIAGDQYEDCLLPAGEFHKHLMDIKMGQFDLATARVMAEDTIAHATMIADQFCAEHSEHEQGWCRDLLQDVSYNIMRIATERELMK